MDSEKDEGSDPENEKRDRDLEKKTRYEMRDIISTSNTWENDRR